MVFYMGFVGVSTGFMGFLWEGESVADVYLIKRSESMFERSLDVSPLPCFMFLRFKCIELPPSYWYEELQQWSFQLFWLMRVLVCSELVFCLSSN